MDCLQVGGHPLQIVLGAFFKERTLPQIGNVIHVIGHGYRLPRYWWMNCTAIEPSPTADATRFTERPRTSPATKMPGTLASSRYGSRSNFQPSGRAPSTIRSGPVGKKQFLSRRTTPSSQSVRGTPP